MCIMLLLTTLFMCFFLTPIFLVHEPRLLSHFPSHSWKKNYKEWSLQKKHLIVFRLNCISLPCHCFSYTVDSLWRGKKKLRFFVFIYAFYFYHHGITWARRREWFFPRNLKNFFSRRIFFFSNHENVQV